MELELESTAAGGGGSRVSLSGESPAAELGRGELPGDHTVSRRHVSLRLLLPPGGGNPKIAFEVVGKNPVVVHSAGGGSERVYRRGEAGELVAGDMLSLSLKAPSFWAVRRRAGAEEVESAVLDAVARRERRTRERKERERPAGEEAIVVTNEEEEASNGEVDLEMEGSELDITTIDPVREFGFLSMGHEFDNYSKGRIRPPKDWNWFLEEIKRISDDEDDEVNHEGDKSWGDGGRKKKKGREGGDEEWAGESEDEKDSLSPGPSVKRSKYATRSKDPKRPRKETSTGKREIEKVKDEEDEEDETLGGFIVDVEEELMEEQSEVEEEEEEFDDEDDDD